MSLQERLYKLEHIYVASPRINGILKEIENCRVDSMVAHPAEYRWSSYRANAQGEEDALYEATFFVRSVGTGRGKPPGCLSRVVSL